MKCEAILQKCEFYEPSSELRNKVTLITPVPVSPAQQFHTPEQVYPRDFNKFVLNEVLLDEVKEPETIDIPDDDKSDEGKWVTVRNKNNKIITKL